MKFRFCAVIVIVVLGVTSTSYVSARDFIVRNAATSAVYFKVDGTLGYVGIATSTPSYRLDVVGTSQFSQPVIVGTPTQNSHATTKSYVDSMFTGSGQWTTNGGLVYLTSTTQNVGIGTTGPTAKLMIVDSSGPVIRMVRTSNRFDVETDNTVMNIGPIDAGDLNLRSGAGVSTVYLTNGNVGIATTTPSYKLDVVGSGQFSQPILVGTPTAVGHAATKSYVDSSVTGAATQWTTTSTGVYYNSGNVGIGTTGPDRSLTVANITGANYINVKDGTREILMGVDATAPGVGIVSVMTAGHDLVLRAGGNSEKVRIQAGGNVGIGTTGPTFKLDVAAGTVGVDDGYGFAFGDGSSVIYGSGTTDYIYLKTAGSDRVTIDNTGNVGIATTTPSYALTVNGYGWFNQPVTVGTPTANSHAATKSYVDSIVGGGAGAGSFTTLAVSATSTLSGNWQLGGAALGNVNMNGFNIVGVNKITASVIDPIYDIDGVKYATYGSDTIGIKTSIYGKATLMGSKNTVPTGRQEVLSSKYGEEDTKYVIPNTEYSYTIDFNKAENGSDLWLFWQTINEGKNMKDMVVTLTPEFDGRAWYELRPNKKQIILYASPNVMTSDVITEAIVSYHLVAPRHDAKGWGNIVKDQTEKASFIIKEK